MKMLERVIDHWGGVDKLAADLGITRHAVYQWRKNGLPELRAYQIARLSQGEFSISELLTVREREPA